MSILCVHLLTLSFCQDSPTMAALGCIWLGLMNVICKHSNFRSETRHLLQPTSFQQEKECCWLWQCKRITLGCIPLGCIQSGRSSFGSSRWLKRSLTIWYCSHILTYVKALWLIRSRSALESVIKADFLSKGDLLYFKQIVQVNCFTSKQYFNLLPILNIFIIQPLNESLPLKPNWGCQALKWSKIK